MFLNLQIFKFFPLCSVEKLLQDPKLSPNNKQSSSNIISMYNSQGRPYWLLTASLLLLLWCHFYNKTRCWQFLFNFPLQPGLSWGGLGWPAWCVWDDRPPMPHPGTMGGAFQTPRQTQEEGHHHMWPAQSDKQTRMHHDLTRACEAAQDGQSQLLRPQLGRDTDKWGGSGQHQPRPLPRPHKIWWKHEIRININAKINEHWGEGCEKYKYS